MKTAECLGKKIFSKAGAENFIKGRKLSRITKKKLRMYFHKRCKGYHLTSQIDGEWN